MWSNNNIGYFAFSGYMYIFIFILSSLSLCSGSCSTRPPIRWRDDGRCGPEYPLSDGQPGQCDPNSSRPCCSDYGYCGNSLFHCSCSGCTDYRNVINTCQFYLTGIEGTMTSPSFPNPFPSHRDCCFDIERPSLDYCGVEISVEYLDMGKMDKNLHCYEDWLSLPSCAPEGDTRICGNKYTAAPYMYLFQPMASAIRFLFHSGNNDFRRNRGFSIKYKVLEECHGPYQTQDIIPSLIFPTPNSFQPCYNRLIGRTGYFDTPFFPKPYPPNSNCVYEFVRENPSICGIRMKSVRFTLENPKSNHLGGACGDFLHMPSCNFMCGSKEISWVVEFQPGAKSLKYHFHSDDSANNKTTPGFYFLYEQITDCP